MAAASTGDSRLPYTEIKDDFLPPRDPVLGYVKIGGKDPTIRHARSTGRPWVAPTRFVDPARFEVTTREKRTQRVKGTGNAAKEDFTVDLGYVRDADFHAMGGVGDKPSALRVRLLYPRWNQNLIAFLGAYGKEWVCRGNGVEATDLKRGACVCPCPRLAQFSGSYEGTKPTDKIKCKPHAQLNVILEDAGVFGGFWAFKTTSFETISNLTKSLRMFEEMFGRIDGLPLELRVMAATKQIPGGGTTTQPIVTLVLPAAMSTARQVAADAAAESRKYLPAAELDETKYIEAVVSEMEEEVESYAGEYMPEEEIPEAEAGEVPVQHDPALPGERESREEFRRDLDKAEAKDEPPRVEEAGDGDSGQAVADRGESQPNEEAPSQPDESPADDDSDRNEPAEPEPELEEYDREDHRLARAVLEEAGWGEAAIAGRLARHVKKGSLDMLLDRLPEFYPDAWAAATERLGLR